MKEWIKKSWHYIVLVIIGIWYILKKNVKIVYQNPIDEQLKKNKEKRVDKKDFDNISRDNLIKFIKRKSSR
jgi:hypothetical protein